METCAGVAVLSRKAHHSGMDCPQQLLSLTLTATEALPWEGRRDWYQVHAAEAAPQGSRVCGPGGRGGSRSTAVMACHLRPGGVVCRYTDLLCHHQIKAVLRGKEAPHTVSSLEGAARRVDDITRKHRALEQQAQHHFLALHLSQRSPQVYSATVLGINKDGSAQLLLTELGLEVAVHLKNPSFPGRTVAVQPQVDVVACSVSWSQA